MTIHLPTIERTEHLSSIQSPSLSSQPSLAKRWKGYTVSLAFKFSSLIFRIVQIFIKTLMRPFKSSDNAQSKKQKLLQIKLLTQNFLAEIEQVSKEKEVAKEMLCLKEVKQEEAEPDLNILYQVSSIVTLLDRLNNEPYLTALDFSSIAHCVTDDQIQQLANHPHLAKIRSINFANVHWKEAWIELLLAKMPKLEEIVLDHSEEITDHVLDIIGKLSNTLKKLSLSGCTSLTSQGIAALMPMLTNLKSLELSFTACDDHVLLSVSHALHRLESLNIEFCKSITNAGVKVLSQQLTQLKHLNLSYCYNVTDDAMLSVATLPKLEMLEVKGCHKLSLVSIEAFQSHTTLQTLDFRQCQVPNSLLSSKLAFELRI